jgi:hypothetical protein
MFRKIVETVVGGAIGLGALYLVAKVSYAEGYNAGSQNEKNPPEENSKKPGKLATLFGLRKAKRSILDDAEVNITISKRREKNTSSSG